LARFETDNEVETTGRPVQILIVQGHPLLAGELSRVLAREVDFAVVGVSSTGADALKATREYQPDVVLMDFRLPDMGGPWAAGLILAAHPAAIVFHSADDSEDALLDAVDAGALAYLTKQATAEQIVDAVRRAAHGDLLIPAHLFVRAIARKRNAASAKRERDAVRLEFTPREIEVLQLLAMGLSTNDMSAGIGIAPHTIEWHVRHVIEKLGVHSKLQAIIAAAQYGLIDLRGPQTDSSD
jgi:two-component system, NarL family, nitrate/nitrite response regulator NarL